MPLPPGHVGRPHSGRGHHSVQPVVRVHRGQIRTVRAGPQGGPGQQPRVGPASCTGWCLAGARGSGRTSRAAPGCVCSGRVGARPQVQVWRHPDRRGQATRQRGLRMQRAGLALSPGEAGGWLGGRRGRCRLARTCAQRRSSGATLGAPCSQDASWEAAPSGAWRSPSSGTGRLQESAPCPKPLCLCGPSPPSSG